MIFPIVGVGVLVGVAVENTTGVGVFDGVGVLVGTGEFVGVRDGVGVLVGVGSGSFSVTLRKLSDQLTGRITAVIKTYFQIIIPFSFKSAIRKNHFSQSVYRPNFRW
jgi:hypothetical protein